MSVDEARAAPVSMLVYNAGGKRLNVVNLPAAGFAPLRGAKVVRVRAPLELDAHLALDGMKAATTALDQCMTGLQKVWHLGADARDVAKPAQSLAALTTYFKSEDYPRVAQREGDTGAVALMLLVDERGKIASCMVTATSGAASLDAQSCALLTERASFAPATDRAGNAIKSGQTARIKWALRRRIR